MKFPCTETQKRSQNDSSPAGVGACAGVSVACAQEGHGARMRRARINRKTYHGSVAPGRMSTIPRVYTENSRVRNGDVICRIAVGCEDGETPSR